jgi:hypothetical protein
MASEDEANAYFDILDQDKRGLISYGEFLAPVMPYMTTKEKNKVTIGEKISIDDLNQLRKLYENSKAIEAKKEGVDSKTSCSMQQFKTDVEINKKPAITRCLQRLQALLPEDCSEISDADFEKHFNALQGRVLRNNASANYFASRY